MLHLERVLGINRGHFATVFSPDPVGQLPPDFGMERGEIARLPLRLAQHRAIRFIADKARHREPASDGPRGGAKPNALDMT